MFVLKLSGIQMHINCSVKKWKGDILQLDIIDITNIRNSRLEQE
jgi:hypothetical protein